MSLIRAGRTPQLFPAKILSVDTVNRMVTVLDTLGNSKKGNVILVTNPGVFSSPRVGDVGLVIGTELGYYFLGKIDYGYARKLKGEVAYAGSTTDESYREAAEGEPYISNCNKGGGLHFSNSGGFSILSKMKRGIQYLANAGGKPLEWLKLIGRRSSLISPGGMAEVSAGGVIRTLPILGESQITDPLPTIPPTPIPPVAYEVLLAIRNGLGQVTERVQLGRVLQEPVVFSPGTPEISTNSGQPVKFVVEVKDPSGSVPMGSIKIDQIGTVEIKATPQLILESLFTYIGGNALTATEPAVLGIKLMAWLNSHTHPTGTGPSGTPTIPALLTDFCSLKIFVA
jgi:hypothetical protein